VSPVQYIAKRDRPVTFCGCKRTQNQPLCDGTHET
jgi:CDGSH-type Zn-finger protein